MKTPTLLFLAPIAVYPIFLLLCTVPWIQKQVIYAHNFHTLWWDDLDEPEHWGFAKNQVTAIAIKTPDGETLYAWHILPRALYAKYESELIELVPHETGDFKEIKDFKETLAFKLLTDDANSKLIINFHGNAGHLVQNRRPDVYKSFSSLDATTHVLAFDYRGFGRSTGSPSEPGLITDGVTVVDYAQHELGLPRSRIVLVGQSLGTGALSGTVEHFAVQDADEARRRDDFAAVLLVSGFQSMKVLLPRYSIGGLIPLLAPLARVPALMDALVSHIAEAWDSRARLSAVVGRVAEDVKAGKERRFNLQLMHAIDDPDIPFDETEALYAELLRVARGTLGQEAEGVDLGSVSDGAVRRNASWPGVKLGLRLVKRGGHNSIPTDTAVAVALMNALGLIEGA